jgi:hypothetical protein
LHSKAFGCIPRHSTPFQGTWLHSQGFDFDLDRLRMESPYDSANRQGKLRARIVQCKKTPSETKVASNSFCIVFSILISKTTTFMYKIKHLDPLTETLLLSITANTIFWHTLHKKCSELQHTLHNFLHWFQILIYPFLTYSCNTNEGKQNKKTR